MEFIFLGIYGIPVLEIIIPSCGLETRMENYSGRWCHTQLFVYSSVGEGKFDMIVFSCIMFQNTQHSAKIKLA